MLFRVDSYRSISGLQVMRMTWEIPQVEDPADFILFGAQYGARYRIEPATGQDGFTAWLVFVSLEGCLGVQGARLIWVDWGAFIRSGLFFSTGDLVKGGLDGLPKRYWDSIDKEDSIFEVVRGDDVFQLSRADWEAYARSGRGSRDLADLRYREAGA